MRGQSGFKGDVRSHLFKITVDTANMFTVDGALSRDEEKREASLSPAYSYLNPSNGATKISFATNQMNDVSLKIFSISGQLVYKLENISNPSGNHMIYWDGLSNTGANVEAGYYFIKILAGTLTSTKKLLIMK